METNICLLDKHNTTVVFLKRYPKHKVESVLFLYVAEEKHSVGLTGLLFGGPASGPPLFCKVEGGQAGTEGLHLAMLLHCCCQKMQKSEAMPVVSVIVLSTRCLLYTLPQSEGALSPVLSHRTHCRVHGNPVSVLGQGPLPFCIGTPLCIPNTLRDVVFLSLFSFSDNLKSQLCSGENDV